MCRKKYKVDLRQYYNIGSSTHVSSLGGVVADVGDERVSFWLSGWSQTLKNRKKLMIQDLPIYISITHLHNSPVHHHPSPLP